MNAVRRAVMLADAAEFAAICAELDPLATRIMTKLLERVIALQNKGGEDEVFSLVEELEAILRSEPRLH